MHTKAIAPSRQMAAVIFEGIAARAKVGTAAATNAAEVGHLAANFARRAIEVIGRAAP
jgi:hypothetical protein